MIETSTIINGWLSETNFDFILSQKILSPERGCLSLAKFYLNLLSHFEHTLTLQICQFIAKPLVVDKLLVDSNPFSVDKQLIGS